MTRAFIEPPLDPQLDLVLEREVPLTPAEMWAAWTVPELLMPWFCPRPWSVSEAQIDLRPGGIFRTVMRSPDGAAHPNEGCFLHLVPERQLVWTNAFGAGFRPRAPQPASTVDFGFTGLLRFEPLGSGAQAGTRYTARVLHATPEGRAQHAAMGFEQGWGAALAQMVEFMQGRRAVR